MTRPSRLRFSRREAMALLAAAAGRPALAGTTVEGSRIAALGRGFNLPDLVPDTRLKPVDRHTLNSLHRSGMTHVRLPVHAEHTMPRFAGVTTIAAAAGDLHRALDLLLGIGFAVTVDMHPGDDFGRLYKADPEAGFRALGDGWAGLASALAKWPASRVFAELLNEPPISDEIWRRHAGLLVRSLRQQLPATTLITGPAPFQRVEALATWPKLPDDNLVYAFHYYDPLAFTHQGASWMTGSPLARLEGVPFPARLNDPKVQSVLRGLNQRGDREFAEEFKQSLAAPWDPDRILAQFAPLAAWSRANAAPVLLNEFGVLRSKAAPADRNRWLSAVRKAAEANRFGWTHWEYDAGFGFVTDGRPDPGTLKALLGP